ncbi:MAG: hypothetical protein SVV80_10260 [Planctomycetota bacterium]|nr:hypothetical protein [Planctomycetota bacterium]
MNHNIEEDNLGSGLTVNRIVFWVEVWSVPAGMSTILRGGIMTVLSSMQYVGLPFSPIPSSCSLCRRSHG